MFLPSPNIHIYYKRKNSLVSYKFNCLGTTYDKIKLVKLQNE